MGESKRVHWRKPSLLPAVFTSVTFGLNMAEVFPDYTDSQLELVGSQGERKVYLQLRSQLNDDFLVLHHVQWIAHNPQWGNFDREADFLVVHKDLGLLIIEVKGGGVKFDGHQWTSIDKNGKSNIIKDPFEQAKSNRYAIESQLKDSGRLNQQAVRDFNYGYGVLFPDISEKDAKQLERPSGPRQIIGCSANLVDLNSWLLTALNYWKKPDKKAPNKIMRSAIKEIFARQIEIQIGRISKFADIDSRRIQLSKNQIEILDNIENLRRVAVSGGAGTGKTILAVTKARRLSKQGFKTVLLCYNKPLADRLELQLKGERNVEARTVHAFLLEHVNKVRRDLGKDYISDVGGVADGSQEFFENHLPKAAANAILDQRPDIDAIVVDEAQDFSENVWLSLELVLELEAERPLYVFYDASQDIFKRGGKIPIEIPPLTLNKNWRNTVEIFESTYKFFSGPDTKHSEISGPAVRELKVKSLREGCEKAARITRDYLVEFSDTHEADAVVLLGSNIMKRDCIEAISKISLPSDSQWNDGLNQGGVGVPVESIARFKGLEAKHVVLLLQADSPGLKEDVYVGGTRATHELSIIYVDPKGVS